MPYITIDGKPIQVNNGLSGKIHMPTGRITKRQKDGESLESFQKRVQDDVDKLRVSGRCLRAPARARL